MMHIYYITVFVVCVNNVLLLLFITAKKESIQNKRKRDIDDREPTKAAKPKKMRESKSPKIKRSVDATVKKSQKKKLKSK